MSESYLYKQDPSLHDDRDQQHILEYTFPSNKSSEVTKADRRSRGEIACAECRRLKIKCDRSIPCGTCIKRGCQSLCPNGTIPPGEGSRFVLAATEHLQGKMAKLEARMHALEDALAIAQTEESDVPHPLLLSRKEVKEEPVAALQTVTEDADAEAEGASNLADALGTLYIDKEGFSRFFGPSGGSESILQLHSRERDPIADSPRHLPELDRSYLPPEIVHFSQCFPMTPPNIPVASIKSSIESLLPPIERAISLCDTFLEHLSWMFHIVSRKQIVDELIPIVYKEKNLSYGPHDLALVLIVCGIGALVDLELEPYNLEAQHYYQLCCAAVVLQPVLEQQSMVTIKVLHLMSIYNGMSGQESNLEQSYALLNLADQVALKIGFHIDPAMWKFDGREVYDRRVYFWNLLSATLWQSLVTGRPPAILSNYIDTKIPTPEEEYTYQLGEVPLGFGTWGFRASDECLLHVVRATLSAKPPPYERVLELDAKIRNFAAVPKADGNGPVDERTALSMRTFVRSHYQDLMLMYLHRAYFTQAMTDYPSNPLLSPYKKSVIAAYQSACFVLDDTRVQYTKKPMLCARVWRIWSFAFTAAVIVGTVATRGFHLNLEPPALEQFASACNVFQNAAETSNRAAKAFPVMQAMLRRAIEAQKNAHRNQLVLDSGLKTEEDELSIMSGKPTFIQGDLPYRSAPKLSASSSSSSTQIYPEQGFSAYSVPPSSSSSSPSGAIQSQTQGGGHISTHHQAYLDAERGDSGYRPNLEVMTDMTDVSYSSGLDKSLSGSVRRPSLSTLTSPFSPYAMQGTSSTTSVGGGVSGGGGTTFADLSAGWGGLFHETAGSMGMYNYSNSGQSRGYGAGGYGQSQGHDQQQQQHGGGGAGVNTATGVAGGSSTTGWGGNHGSSSGMGTYSGGLGTTLNDKWSSFMINYNVLDPAPAPSLSTVPQAAGTGAGAVISGEGGQGRYSHSYSRTSHYGHSGYQ